MIDTKIIFTLDNYIIELVDTPEGVGRPLKAIRLENCNFQTKKNKIVLKEKMKLKLYERVTKHKIYMKDSYFLDEIEAIL